MNIISSFLFLFVSLCAFGQDRAQKLDSLLNSFANKGNLNGNILIAEKGDILYNKSFGFSNLLTQEKLNENSIFELASVSKQFTAMGIVKLKEEGKLKFDDKMTKYLPELSSYSNISIRNLLNHTNGLPDYMELLDSVFDKNKIATNKDIISLFATYKPAVIFESNTKWEYSNTGYALLASIIERVSGMPYGDYLSKAIFEPLGMTRSFVYTRRFAPKHVDNYAYGYVFSDAANAYLLPDSMEETNIVVWLDGIVGDGSVNSTVVDLLKWDRALYGGEFISEEDKKEIFTSAMLIDSTKTDYGFGWFLNDNGVYGKIVQHTGGWPGYRTLIERHLDSDKTIIVLLNAVNDDTYIPFNDLRRILYNISPIKFVELSNDIKEKYAGNYQNVKGKIVKIVFENGTLYKLSDSGDKQMLKPISNSKFQLLEFEPDVFIEFIMKEGKVEKYILTQPEENVERVLVKVN